MSGATKGGWIHGRTVVDGIVRFLSVSSMQKAELCMRRWWYAYIQGLKDEETDATRRGVAKHKEIANYLITGSRAGLSAQVLSGMFMIPEPGKDLDVELDVLTRPGIDIEFTAQNSPILLRDAPLKAAGIAITGAIDLRHKRGTNKGTTDITQAKDPAGTREVIDWKFTGNMNNAKPGHELLKTIQMCGYGKYVFNTDPDAKLVRLSHGYMPVKGRPAKMTMLHDRDQIERAWESVEVLAGSIRDAAKETNPDLIDANTRSCRAFGKDCPAKGVCKAAGHDSLSEIVGIVAARDELEIEPGPGEFPTMPSLAEQLRAKKAAASNNTATKSGPSPEEVKAEKQKIARDEANAKFPGLMELLDKIKALDCGYPMITGEMAKAKGLLTDPPYEINGASSGAGELGDYSCATIEELDALYAEAVTLLSADADAPTDVETKTETKVDPKVDEAANQIAAAADTSKKKRKGKKDQGGETANAAAKQTPTNAGEASSGATTSAPAEVNNTPATAGFYFYVDCSPSVPFQSFWPVVFETMNYLAEKCGKEEGKVVPDVRLADPNGKAGFGRWKALISTYLKEREYEPGHWVLNGATGEIEQEIVRTMHEICLAYGGVFVR